MALVNSGSHHTPAQKIGLLTTRGNRYAKVKATTQFIVGASDETDMEIVKYTAGMYRKLNLNRVYFSSYQRGLGDTSIPGETIEFERKEQGFIREHRLYQTDFLLRKYGFSEQDILYNQQGNLLLDRDPKLVWADAHPEFFPVNINRADKKMLLRIPGIGPETALKIVMIRKEGKIHHTDNLPLRGKRLELVKRYARV